MYDPELVLENVYVKTGNATPTTVLQVQVHFSGELHWRMPQLGDS